MGKINKLKQLYFTLLLRYVLLFIDELANISQTLFSAIESITMVTRKKYPPSSPHPHNK